MPRKIPIALQIVVPFVILVPLVTLGLLMMKGLPSFTNGYEAEVVVWVYRLTWLPGFLSGGLLALVLISLRSRIYYFIRPYDLGRCFSLGAITGAVAEAFSTWAYRAISHHPFSSFWIAGAIIAGAVTGSALTSLVLWRLSRLMPKISI